MTRGIFRRRRRRPSCLRCRSPRRSSAAVAVAAQHGPLGPCWRRRRRKAFETETSSSPPSLSSPLWVVVGRSGPSSSSSSRRERDGVLARCHGAPPGRPRRRRRSSLANRPTLASSSSAVTAEGGRERTHLGCPRRPLARPWLIPGSVVVVGHSVCWPSPVTTASLSGLNPPITAENGCGLGTVSQSGNRTHPRYPFWKYRG